VYSLQYLGPPYVWAPQLLGDNISIQGPNAAVIASGIVYWMGVDKFYSNTMAVYKRLTATCVATYLGTLTKPKQRRCLLVQTKALTKSGGSTARLTAPN
jgi:hypothetical protein